MSEAYLAYNFHWGDFPQEKWPFIIREYLDYGIEHFVFTDPLIRKCLAEPDFLDYMKSLCEEYGVHFVAMHAICGRNDDLDTMETEQRPRMIADHIRSLQIAADFGVKTYTVHPGAYFHVVPEYHTPLEALRRNTLEALDAMVPVAEKCGVVIAVENSFEPPNSPDEVLYYVNHYSSSPAVGVCYDTGHANLMAPFPGKKAELYASYMPSSWWENGIIEEPAALDKLFPHIVTTHIHDNNGYGDLHAMPYDGNIDWNQLMPRLRSCPRMLEYQTEVCFQCGENWAGKLLAPKGGYSIKRQVETFRKLFAL